MHTEQVPSTGPVTGADIHHPTGWWNWKVVAYSKLTHSLRASKGVVAEKYTYSGAVIIIGLSLGLFGYDNNFAAPLMQLPYFILKYQGLAISFTVSSFPITF